MPGQELEGIELEEVRERRPQKRGAVRRQAPPLEVGPDKKPIA